MSRVPLTDGYPHMVQAMVLMSIGMGLTMAPATESIMGSLPREKAGVGSAMNDTTRQVGGALGVAIMGSVLATSYRPGVNDKLAGLGLAPDVVAQARDSVGGAVQAAQGLPDAVGRLVSFAGRSEFVDGFHTTLLLAAAVSLIAAGVVFLFLPARATDHVAAELEAEGLPLEVEGLAALTFAEADGALALGDVEAREDGLATGRGPGLR
jgi:predicted MFS family arabinose efflux permease